MSRDEKIISASPAEIPASLTKKMQGNLTVNVTRDYEKFRFLEGNRIVGENKIAMMVQSIKLVGYIPNPIIVNENMEIIDGQTRLAACKRLGLPIPYITVKGIGIAECIAMNLNQKNWTAKDFIRCYSNQKKPGYPELEKLVDKYKGLPLKAIVCATQEKIILDASGQFRKVVNGTFVFGRQFKKAEKMLDHASMFLPLKQDKCRTVEFLGAILFIIETLDEDGKVKEFMAKFNRNASKLRACAKSEDVLRAISDIYNIRLSEENKRYFDIEYRRQVAKWKKNS